MTSELEAEVLKAELEDLRASNENGLTLIQSLLERLESTKSIHRKLDQILTILQRGTMPDPETPETPAPVEPVPPTDPVPAEPPPPDPPAAPPSPAT